MSNKLSIMLFFLLVVSCRKMEKFDQYLKIRTNRTSQSEAELIQFLVNDAMEEPEMMGSFFFETRESGGGDIFWKVLDSRACTGLSLGSMEQEKQSQIIDIWFVSGDDAAVLVWKP